MVEMLRFCCVTWPNFGTISDDEDVVLMMEEMLV